ncbi:hypothetical protein [Deinococcus arcticus]|uniref:Uncharacterized protein n=1 Tax=Deinococcus arcticus TaxID=2136176 RepID=A0A2T3W686_9DEIO|nr:hypothetical protein [Deinococcus arcticus]PTA67416.1 hypothetical protein C8263_12655 [Deinococcus arcticus]
MRDLLGGLLEGLIHVVTTLDLPWRWMFRVLGTLLTAMWPILNDQTLVLLGGLLLLGSFVRWPGSALR